MRQFAAEPRREPGAHLLRGGDGVGHCQDGFRRNTADLGHIAQPGDEHGSFAAARHRQQQHRAVDRLHRRALLVVQGRQMGRFKYSLVHGSSFRAV